MTTQLKNIDIAAITRVVDANFKRNGQSPHQLLQILVQIEAEYHHIPGTAIELIAKTLSIPRASIISLIDFYSFLNLTPQGNYVILISDSITDRMLGNQLIIDLFCKTLNITVGKLRSDGRVSIKTTSCTGLCEQGPAALINGYAVPHLNAERVAEIVHMIEAGTPLNQWPAHLFQIDNNVKQRDILLNYSQESGQYNEGDALKTLFDRGLQKSLDELTTSGLRGRGGAGFKTSMKWHFCHESYTTGDADDNLGLICDVKPKDRDDCDRVVVCNADEGEPGTFKDRLLLTTHAHQLIEGMTICAAIIGACRGFIYLRGEYRYLYDSLRQVLDDHRKQNLLGDSILGEQFNFDIQIHLGAGAYICGEESALIESLEGHRGIPRNRPPFPVTQGYLNKPTVVNNVETFINAAMIVDKGGDWFAEHGTEQSAGTKLLSISGDCTSPGIYEYPFGITVREILNHCGADPELLGVQVGGPSGTFITSDEFERQIAFEDLASGGSFIIFNSSRCLFDIVQNFTQFFSHESCGFCTPCRVGTTLLTRLFDKIHEGHGSAGDLVELEEIGKIIKSASHCGLGQTAANPILTTLHRLPNLYQMQLKQIGFEPGFDLDGALDTARRLTHRDDAAAHLAQREEME
ncbi:MAG: NAD(P)H-dependent oxidoreductase subunit E [Chromatiales bacterium]|nr:NAD(P)H-dependent oxidoreductase subunit E [Chromatiales bacterium]